MQLRRSRTAILFLAMTTIGAHPGISWELPQNNTTPSSRAAEFAQVSRQAPDVVRVAQENGVYVEKLKGEAAMTHLYNLFSRRPDAFKEARKALKARGFRPSDQVYVERTVRLASNRQGTDQPQAVPAQDFSEQNSDGEIVFWSWDDGNDATWEGTIYMEVYSTGDASTWEGQIDASNEDHSWVYYEKTWSGTDKPGGDPLPATEDAPPLPSRPSGRVTYANLSRAPWTPQANGMIVEAGWLSWAGCWRSCVVGGCAAVAFTCIATGPGWPGCFGFGCVGAEIGCAVSCFFAE